jgi:hypothetical protein
MEFSSTGTSLKLIKSYLEGRHQRVILNNNPPDSCSSWGEIRHLVLRRSVLGLLLLLLHITDLPEKINDNAEIVVFVDETSVILTNLNPINFKRSVIKVFQDINIWFTVNLLSVNVDETQFMHL